ncbi:hypothetical protein A2230_04195 [candidate division WOR-1 bacterium RIFOXYA2_FULL_36_21]|uniref:M23ase beta-sheet core domain-containing protein n=1 Tax=candidate division WOR-1 bacterium RIFOXYB2_FULL_36_35 TaxID=1802578 RepID=A0A1F4RY91_UNCSA|nr:MAG: hypothetical protein A2230_04195 [candidate division WOR-1 bacterium RIFOXYA2_FULL_36_21]OGC13145.1 MAG: hypothetical protein A2290_07540 [candidate division WOR-1 bacterium RIFOXYB2_FULL_36_35]OGC16917.1 MAG: hypothetical protein A2282_05695 [candidate division WOR-1 bacterium RIFOXYA12_FULL_36_13]
MCIKTSNKLFSVFICLLGLFSFFIYGCSQSSSSSGGSGTQQSTDVGAIKGYVKEILTNNPIEGAVVSIEGNSISATTDSLGYFIMQSVPAGTEKLLISADNYESSFESFVVTKDQTLEVSFYLIPYYPVTTAVPSMIFTWETSTYGPLLFTSTTTGDIYGCAPFAITEESGTLNQEMAIFFMNRYREPIYAPFDGVITYFVTWENFENAESAGNGGEVWIRYGKNYAIGYRHIVTTGVNLTVGQKVSSGDVVGYLADKQISVPLGAFHEFAFGGKEGADYYFYKPYDYYDEASKSILLDIWNGSYIKTDYGYNTVTTPWGDVDKFTSSGANQEIPTKGRI